MRCRFGHFACSAHRIFVLVLVTCAAGCGSTGVGVIDTEAALREVVASGGRDFTTPVPAPSELKKPSKATSRAIAKRAKPAAKAG